MIPALRALLTNEIAAFLLTNEIGCLHNKTPLPCPLCPGGPNPHNASPALFYLSPCGLFIEEIIGEWGCIIPVFPTEHFLISQLGSLEKSVHS